MDLTNEDVTDILALLDSLPYDEFDLQTARFRLILRRTPDGWTQSMQTRSAPDVLDAAAPGGPLRRGAARGASGPPGPGLGGPAGRQRHTGPASHTAAAPGLPGARNRPDGTSVSP